MFRRRTFLGATVSAGVAMVDTPRVGIATNRTITGIGDPYEETVRDANPLWRRLPSNVALAPTLGDGRHIVRVHGARSGTALAFTAADTAVLTLLLAGTVTSVDWELDMWHAELAGRVTTTRGSLVFTALVHRHQGTLVVRLVPEGGERASRWAGEGVGWRERHDGSGRLVSAAFGGRPPMATDLEAHRRWWRDFHSVNLLSIPDRTLRRFHVRQQYRAAATGRGGTFLNGTGHFDIAPPAGDPDQRHRIAAIPGTGSKAGGAANPVAAWGLPEKWLAYRHRMDDRMLHEDLVPLLRRAIGFYRPFLTEGADGRLHLPLTHSPTYTDVVDCTYDLSLIRWALTRAIELGMDGGPGGGLREIRDRLVPYHTSNGEVLIGAGVRLAESHRHASHLAWLYPLRERVSGRTTLDRWASMREVWHGDSYVRASSMYAVTGVPDRALEMLRHFVSGHSSELDDAAPSACQAILDMLVHSTRGRTRLFAATPWQDVSLAGLRAEGGFVIDAARHAGTTEWVRLHSTTNAPIVLDHGIVGRLEIRDERGRSRRRPPGPVRLRLAKGQTVTIVREGRQPHDRLFTVR